jgi:hypothetical protein
MNTKRPYGYWKDFKNIERELKEITDSIDKVPTYTELRKLGRSDLAKAIQKNGGLSQFRILFGRESEITKKLEDYKDWNKISNEFRVIISELGDFPSAKILKNKKLFYLLDASTKYHEGLPSIRKRLGYEENQKPKNYWGNIENVLNESKLIISNYGDLPSSDILLKDGYSSYVNAVSTKHGGFSKIRGLLGLSKLQEVDAGYWQSIENIQVEIDILKEKTGDYPLPSDFKLLGKSNVLYAIERHYKGLYNLYTLLNIPTNKLKKPDNYYECWENIKSEIEEIINNVGHFPSDQELLFLEKTSLRNGIRKHGGLKKVAEKLGIKYKYVIAKDGHYCDSFAEKIIDDILFDAKIEHQRGITFKLEQTKAVPDFILPNNILIEVLMVSPYSLTKNQIEKSYVNRYLKKKTLYEKYGYSVIEILPEEYTNKELLTKKVDYLFNIISVSKDNIKEIVNHNYLHDNKKPIGYWRNIENIKLTLEPLCNELKRFPSWSEMESKYGTGVIKGIKKYHISFENVAVKMGFKYQKDAIRKSDGFWKDINNVLIELNKVIETKEDFPTASYLHKNFGSLYYAINKYHGGLENVKQKATTANTVYSK